VTLYSPLTLSGTIEQHRKLWCMYTHSVAGAPGEPPVTVYVGACLLRDVFTAPDARRNSEWLKTVQPDSTVLMLSVMATGDMSEMLNKKAVMVRDMSPICNRIGRDVTTMARMLTCSNGKTYRSQQDAADELGINQSQLSKHLRGVAGYKSVKGYTFRYGE
jgi:hypothetical protein